MARLHEARSLVARNSAERVAWGQVRSGVERIRFFSTHSSGSQASKSEKSVIMMVLKGVVFLRDYLTDVPLVI